MRRRPAQRLMRSGSGTRRLLPSVGSPRRGRLPRPSSFWPRPRPPTTPSRCCSRMAARRWHDERVVTPRPINSQAVHEVSRTMGPSATPAPSFAWPRGYRAAAAFTFDLDAESAILVDAPEAAGRLSVMTHQAYGPRTGVPRLLRILDRQAIRATFFIPGYSADRWPGVVRSIRDAGHEIAHHGYLHEQVSGVTPEQEERLLLRGLEALDRVAGIRPI